MDPAGLGNADQMVAYIIDSIMVKNRTFIAGLDWVCTLDGVLSVLHSGFRVGDQSSVYDRIFGWVAEQCVSLSAALGQDAGDWPDRVAERRSAVFEDGQS